MKHLGDDLKWILQSKLVAILSKNPKKNYMGMLKIVRLCAVFEILYFAVQCKT